MRYLKTWCLNFLSALLAASGQNSCTSLVCSCYVPSRCSDCKDDQVNDRLQSQGNSRTNGTHIDPTPLKSSIKRSTKVEVDQERVVTRKVNWSDAHGKDIANVQMFEASMSENGELEGVQNSCVCAIQ